MSAEMDYIHYVVIGMGINVNTTEFDDSIKATASSLYLETGDHLKRSRIVAAFSESFAKYYDTFVKTQNLAGLKEDYNSMLVNKGGDVKAIYMLTRKLLEKHLESMMRASLSLRQTRARRLSEPERFL